MNTTDLFQQALTHQRAGELEQASFIYHAVLAEDPQHDSVLHHLGLIYHAQGNISSAIDCLTHALTLNPNDANYHFCLGLVWLGEGKLEESRTHLEEALFLNPECDVAYAALGKIYQSQGDIVTAITCWQQAVYYQPQEYENWFDLAGGYAIQHEMLAAISCYQKVTQLKPDFVPAHLQLADLLAQTRDIDQAAYHYDQVLIWQPDSVQATFQLALLRRQQGRDHEALNLFAKTFTLNTEITEARWLWHLYLPIFYDDFDEILVWRERLSEGLKFAERELDLKTEAGKKNALKNLNFIVMFYLTYQGLDDKPLMIRYAQIVQKVLWANYPDWAAYKPQFQIRLGQRLRIGYLSAFFYAQPVADHFGGWILKHDSIKFAVNCYHLGKVVDAETHKIKAACNAFYHFPADWEAAYRQIKEDELDILIFLDLGMEPLTLALASFRLVPVQMMAWGQPVTSGFENIDYFISNAAMEPPQATSHYAESLLLLPKTGVCFSLPAIPNLPKSRSYFGLAENIPLYLCSQLNLKYLPQHDRLLAQIARQIPQAQFIFIRRASQELTERLLQRLQRTFADFGLDALQYCVVLPPLSRIDYLHLNRCVTVFLDTLLWSGGNTTFDALACGLPVVTSPGPWMRSRQSYGMLQQLGVTETIAQDEDEYVAIAVRLAQDPQWRQELHTRLLANQRNLFGDQSGVQALEQLYLLLGRRFAE